MPDPITLAALSTLAVTEGVKFLYNQAGELLKYWREKKKAAAAATPPPSPPDVTLPAKTFEGQLASPKIHEDVLERVQPNIGELLKDLSNYAIGFEEIDTGNEAVLSQVDALRQLLEAVYQQRITFKGEKGREPSGPIVGGKIDVVEVEGYAAAVRAKNVTGGTLHGEAKAEKVKPGGMLIATDVGNVGPGSSGSNN